MKDTFEERLTRAMNLRASGEYEAVLALMIELAGERPESAFVQYQAAAIHDRLGLEKAAVPYYEKALALGLSDPEDEANAYLGLGSTYRTLGDYENARRVLMCGRGKFPSHRSFDVFLAMTLHNVGEHTEAMRLLLLLIADTSGDAEVVAYKRAIAFYAENIDRIWPGDDDSD
ncbi:tetratricopeptide (TPR) repeat protein [Paraburkholderia sp. GAS38]|uniref:tetratricopeptide repeat protein n=1 Tax=Paraburkholderia sp. GAS38 TaxID=3035133 RepID=UPI003D1BE881